MNTKILGLVIQNGDKTELIDIADLGFSGGFLNCKITEETKIEVSKKLNNGGYGLIGELPTIHIAV